MDNEYPGLSKGGFTNEHDCAVECMDITACGLVGYEFKGKGYGYEYGEDPTEYYCICLYQKGMIPEAPDGWTLKDEGKEGIGAIDMVGKCDPSRTDPQPVCYVYTVSSLQSWDLQPCCFTYCLSRHHISQKYTATLFYRMMNIAAKHPLPPRIPPRILRIILPIIPQKSPQVASRLHPHPQPASNASGPWTSTALASVPTGKLTASGITLPSKNAAMISSAVTTVSTRIFASRVRRVLLLPLVAHPP